MKFEYTCNSLPMISKSIVYSALPEDQVEEILMNGGCHVDHEGFDLNDIEQAYYAHNKISLTYDKTWYKDGGQTKGTNATIYPWFEQTRFDKLVLDHSHFVFKFPIEGEAKEQIRKYAVKRPELMRLLSARFKAGLDLCIDYFGEDRVEPIIHIEWDYDNMQELYEAVIQVEEIIQNSEWLDLVPTILRFNDLARKKKLDAFQQSDTRSMIIFGEKSYKLIPTL
jgi:hypothetical protein